MAAGIAKNDTDSRKSKVINALFTALFILFGIFLIIYVVVSSFCSESINGIDYEIGFSGRAAVGLTQPHGKYARTVADKPAIKHASIRKGTKIVKSGLFLNCMSLETAILPDSVTAMGDEVFCGCRKLYAANLPPRLTEVPDKTFFGCSRLVRVNIPDDAVSIGTNAFAGCSSLKSITIPDRVVVIESRAFARCTALESIIIPQNTVSIGAGCFQQCEN